MAALSFRSDVQSSQPPCCNENRAQSFLRGTVTVYLCPCNWDEEEEQSGLPPYKRKEFLLEGGS